jgi:hypothetical protein
MKKIICLLCLLLVVGCENKDSDSGSKHDRVSRSGHVHIPTKEASYNGLTITMKGYYFLKIVNNTENPVIVRGISYYKGENTQWVISIDTGEIYSFKDKEHNGGIYTREDVNRIYAIYVYTKDGGLQGFTHISYLDWEVISEF